MAKKSKAQIARMKLRAAARGEEYVTPVYNVIASESLVNHVEQDNNDHDSRIKNSTAESLLLAAAKKLTAEIQRVESCEKLNAKERRSAKRKAEAIALEESGISAEKLLEWYTERGQSDNNVALEKGTNVDKEKNGMMKSKTIPYILFIGQLSYQTTKEELFNHIRKELGEEHDITPETVRIRLLTDPKTKKSRGMAFLETNDPDLMYACLKLHQTNLGDRRINVERSAGGRKANDVRKAKIKQFREEQEQHFSHVVDKLIASHVSSGEIREGELDEGVVGLCKRHSLATVEKALIRYVETRGCDKDNPSAYFSSLIGKVATDGAYLRGKLEKPSIVSNMRRPAEKTLSNKRKLALPDQTHTGKGEVGNKLRRISEFAKSGVDMTISEGNTTDFKKIFPSMNRGRGRGYM